MRIARILTPHLCPDPVSQLLQLNLDNREALPEEFGLLPFNEVREGRDYLSHVRFCFAELDEPGSIDDLLKHLRIKI